MLDLLEQVGPLDYEALGVEEARQLQAALAPAEPTEPTHEVADRTIPGPAGDLPVRVYRPGDEEGYPTVVTAGFDPLRDEGIAYAGRLADADVPTTHRHYDGMIHGFASMLTGPARIDRGHEAIEAVAGDLRDALDG